MSSQARKAKKSRLRDRVLDAARDLFIQHGFEAVTMRRIAEKVVVHAHGAVFSFSTTKRHSYRH